MKKKASMTVAAAAVVTFLVACSSSSSGGSSDVPACKGNTGASGPGSAACSSCLQSNCGSQIASEQGACGAYNSCYEACDCSNLTCLTDCQSRIDSACQSPYGAVTTCLSQNCQMQCAVTVIVGEGGTD